MTLPKLFYCYNHQSKGTEYVRALQTAGFRLAGLNSASVLLMDYDIPARIKILKQSFLDNKVRLFVYPHAARPNILWDGVFQKSPYICGIFVSAEGHGEILRRIGIKHPIIPAGWAYCARGEFVPNANPQKILFAPIHPTRRGFLAKIDAELNLRTFQKLLSVRDQFKITVRHIQSLKKNGLPRIDGITYTDAQTDLKSAATQIAENDVIVGHQTIAYIAVAMGKPTLMMGEDVPPRNGTGENDFKFVDRFNDYKDLLMYPLDILAEDDTIGLILRATRTDEEIQDWRERMIGKPFNPKLVSDTVVSYL